MRGSLSVGLVSGAVVFLGFPPFMLATTILVPKDQPTIQQAITAATNGDTVLVSPGIYSENIDFEGKAIIVTSVKGPTVTVIDGGGSVNPVVTLQSGEGLSSALSGFAIRNGAASFGSGIYLLGASATIVGNYFYENNEGSGGYGAAIGGNGSSPDIERNVFWKNTCDTQFLSGVVSFVNESSPLIVNNIFHNNACRAIDMTLPEGSQPHVINNTIFNNSVGIRVDARVPTAQQVYENNLIVSNQTGLEVDFGSPANNPTWQNNDVFDSGSNYSGIADQTGTSGNISINPTFLSSSNFHLQFGSPVIDAGNISAPGLPSTDFDGFPRTQADSVGIGAYEFFSTAMNLSSTSLMFASQPVGTTSQPQNVTVRNTGSLPLFLAISANGDFHESSNCEMRLDPATTCTVKVEFRPTKVGLRTGTLKFSDNASGSPQPVSLMGTGN